MLAGSAMEINPLVQASRVGIAVGKQLEVVFTLLLLELLNLFLEDSSLVVAVLRLKHAQGTLL